jgi:serine/threonine-protein kinase
MELLDGEDLAHRIARGRLPTYRALRIGREVLAGLAVAHAQGIVHRDLKPGNVFLARTPAGDEVAKILDFGISKVRTEDPSEELTRTGTMLGTPHYMAPEQFRESKSVDGRADLYSVGALIYEALSRRLPHDGDTLEALIATKLTDPPRPLFEVAPDLPRAVSDALMRALEPDPARRYQSAAEMDAALAAVEAKVGAPGVMMSPAGGSGASSQRPPPMAVTPSGLGTPSWDRTPSLSGAPAPRSAASRALPWLAGLAGMMVAGLFVMLALTIAGYFFLRREISAWTSDAPAAPAPVSAPPPAVSAPPSMPTLTPIPVPVPMPAPAPSAPDPAPRVAPAPRGGDVSGVHVSPTTMGLVDADGVRALGERARPALAACRNAHAYSETIQFVVAVGGALMRAGEPSPDRQHQCVIDALTNAGPVRTVASGIARFQVTLDPT